MTSILELDVTEDFRDYLYTGNIPADNGPRSNSVSLWLDRVQSVMQHVVELDADTDFFDHSFNSCMDDEGCLPTCNRRSANELMAHLNYLWCDVNRELGHLKLAETRGGASKGEALYALSAHRHIRNSIAELLFRSITITEGMVHNLNNDHGADINSYYVSLAQTLHRALLADPIPETELTPLWRDAS